MKGGVGTRWTEWACAEASLSAGRPLNLVMYMPSIYPCIRRNIKKVAHRRKNIKRLILFPHITSICPLLSIRQQTIRQHTSAAYLSIRQQALRQHTSADSSIREHTSVYRVPRPRASVFPPYMLFDLLPLKINVVQSNRLYSLKSYLVITCGREWELRLGGDLLVASF